MTKLHIFYCVSIVLIALDFEVICRCFSVLMYSFFKANFLAKILRSSSKKDLNISLCGRGVGALASYRWNVIIRQDAGP